MSGDDNFVSRWSRRKIAARSGNSSAEAGPDRPPAAVVPAQAGTQAPEPMQSEVPLPPIESLTPDSDFTAFMKPDVDPAVRREALKVLVRDPRFNVMDGLDVYIDDYSKPDPLPEEWLAQLNMFKRLSSLVEEPENPAAKPSEELQKQMPQPVLQPDAERISSGTERDDSMENRVTESGIAGGKLPQNEA
jgi:hypothetical protein